MSEFGKPRSGRFSWFASVAFHAIVIAAVATISWRAVPHVTFLNLASPQEVDLPELPPSGTAAGRPSRPGGGNGERPKTVPVPVPVVQSTPVPTPTVAPVDTATAAKPAPPGPPGPALGDGKLWAAPRPALPSDVAAALYEGRHKHPTVADSVVTQRLKAMVDSVNRLIDQEQRAHRSPVWTGDIGGKKFGLDSSGIYVAGVKIPTAVLAALGSALPRGNFDLALQNERTAELSADLLEAARRAQNTAQFKLYVAEIRARKQAERDAHRRQVGDTFPQDTAQLVP